MFAEIVVVFVMCERKDEALGGNMHAPAEGEERKISCARKIRFFRQRFRGGCPNTQKKKILFSLERMCVNWWACRMEALPGLLQTRARGDGTERPIRYQLRLNWLLGSNAKRHARRKTYRIANHFITEDIPNCPRRPQLPPNWSLVVRGWCLGDRGYSHSKLTLLNFEQRSGRNKPADPGEFPDKLACWAH